MTLAMNREVFITCAVTGSGDTTGKSDKVPVTPAQIADSAIEAAHAGAAVVHCHVRDPETGKPSRDPGLFREVNDEYFRRIHAVEFTVKADDGKEPRVLRQADIVLVGVSRTSKMEYSTRPALHVT